MQTQLFTQKDGVCQPNLRSDERRAGVSPTHQSEAISNNFSLDCMTFNCLSDSGTWVVGGVLFLFESKARFDLDWLARQTFCRNPPGPLGAVSSRIPGVEVCGGDEASALLLHRPPRLGQPPARQQLQVQVLGELVHLLTAYNSTPCYIEYISHLEKVLSSTDWNPVNLKQYSITIYSVAQPAKKKVETRRQQE